MGFIYPMKCLVLSRVLFNTEIFHSGVTVGGDDLKNPLFYPKKHRERGKQVWLAENLRRVRFPKVSALEKFFRGHGGVSQVPQTTPGQPEVTLPQNLTDEKGEPWGSLPHGDSFSY